MAQHMIAPRWEGIYQYDESPALPPDQPSVNFALQFQVDEGGQISGWIHDGKYGIPEPAVVKGKISLNQIWFKKTYRSLWFFSETGESCEIPEAGPHTIHYEGVLDSTATQMTGTWRIKPRSNIHLDGIEYDYPEVTGTWIARPSRLKLFDRGQ